MTSVMPTKKASALTPPTNVVPFPTKDKPQKCELTPQQEKLWSDTRVALLWHQPAFSHIFYSMLDNAGSKRCGDVHPRHSHRSN